MLLRCIINYKGQIRMVQKIEAQGPAPDGANDIFAVNSHRWGRESFYRFRYNLTILKQCFSAVNLT